MRKDFNNISAVKQGEFRVSRTPDDLFICILGSCIATCFHDPVARIGGMNHFLLPGRDPGATREVKYGAHAMEQLVNAMLRAGAARERFEVQIFGGAKVIKSAGRIGENNARFARDFVRDEGYQLRHANVGGLFGRRLSFQPSTGHTSMKFLQNNHDLPPDTGPMRPSGSIELF